VSEEALDPEQVILVVEDEILIRMAVAAYLRDCGYRVTEAASADEAMVMLRHLEIDVQVILSDVEMPGSMDGFQLSSGCVRIVAEST
jgi:CheY-like chemotaxis protein